MGIDIYARWKGQLPSEVIEQYKVWRSASSGEVGYLREAYHGEPYATQHFVPEAFECNEGAEIAAKVLRERLPETLRIAEERERKLYGATSKADVELILESYRAFVELCERIERETGRPVRIVASW